MASIGDRLAQLFSGLSSLSVDVVADAIALWETARASIRTVAQGIAQAAMQGELNAAMAQYKDVPLTPAVLADMAIRNIAGMDFLVPEAAYSGLSEDRFKLLVEETGESYGIIDALRLWHQGSYLGQDYGIGEDELNTVIYYSRVRDQFLPDLKKISWHTMSGADAIETLVKGKVDAQQAQAWWAAAGGIPDQFNVLYESAGDAIGTEKATELWAHGDIDEAQLNDIYGQSRLNPRFYDIARLTNRKWLQGYQLRQVLASGVVDENTAIGWLLADGYEHGQAVAMVNAALLGNIHTHKAETEGQIVAEYEAQIIDDATATKALEDLGYSSASVPFILEAATARRMLAMRNAVITRLRASVLIGDTSINDARTDLGKLGLPTPAIDAYLIDWQIEAATPHTLLSTAEVGKLVEENMMDPGTAVTYWQRHGFTQTDAEALLLIYQPGAKATPGGPTPPQYGSANILQDIANYQAAVAAAAQQATANAAGTTTTPPPAA